MSKDLEESLRILLKTYYGLNVVFPKCIGGSPVPNVKVFRAQAFRR